MRVLQEIFAEVVDKNARIADHGRILDARGEVVKDFEGIGLPAYLEFEVPAGSEFFTLEVHGTRVHQPLSDRSSAPISPPPIPDALPVTAPPSQPEKAPAVPKQEPVAEDENADWRGIDLEMVKPGEQPGEIDLDKQKDE